MKLEYQNAAEPGYGKFIITGLPDAMDGIWQMALYNSGGLFANNDWDNPLVDSEVFIPVTAHKTGENTLEIELEPVVVDHFDPTLNYKATLKNPAGQKYKPTGVAIKNVSRSTDKRLIKKEEPDPVKKSSPEPHPNTGSIFNTASGSTETPASKPEKPETVAEPLAQPNAQPATKPVEADAPLNEASLRMPEPKANRSRKIWIVAMLALLALATITWYLLDNSRKTAESSPPAQNSAQTAPTAENNASQADDLETQVRAFFSNSDKDASKAVTLGNTFKPANQKEQDAVYRLYYYAAQAGEPEGLLKYAAILDPSKPAWGTISKDGSLAWVAYEQAKTAKQAEAENAQKELESWLADESAKGNKDAQSWLAKINPEKK